VESIAAVLAIIAAVAFALAATLWQRASLELGVEQGGTGSLIRLLGSGVWLLGLVAQVAGVVLQAAALDRGRVAIIQPLLVTTIIWAMPLGYFMTGQTITRRHVLGAAVVVAGLAAFALYGDPAGGNANAAASTWLAAFLVLAAICGGVLLFGRRVGPAGRAAVFGGVAGILYGVAATLMKPVVEDLHDVGVSGVLGSWEVWVMAGAGLVGFILQQVSLATGKLVASVATVSVANPVVSVLLGVLVLEERLDRDPPWHAVAAVGALAVALFGAVLIASAADHGEDVSDAGELPADAAPAPA
jgi:drug/metabolite transporter (DMT)-like permease